MSPRQFNTATADLCSRFRAEAERIEQGGGPAASQRQHAKGRLTARERIALLLDAGSPWLEIGLWAGWQMYADWGGARRPEWSAAWAWWLGGGR